MFERPVINVTDHDGLEEFGEVNDRYPGPPPEQVH